MKSGAHFIWPLLILLLLAGCRLGARRQTPPDPVEPAEIARHIPAYRSFDRRPYEFIWADREPDVDQLIDFERLLDWEIEAAPGVQADFVRCQTQQLWDGFVGRVTVSTDAPGGWVRWAPVEPLPVRDPVNALTLWVHLANPVPPSTLQMEFVDAEDRPTVLEFALNTQPGWHLLYHPLPATLTTAQNYPIYFRAFRWLDVPMSEQLELRMDALAVFMDGVEPLDFARRPQRPVPLLAGQPRGSHTGDGQLNFPIDPNTVIPAPLSVPARPLIEAVDTHTFDLFPDGTDRVLGFRVHTRNGLNPIQLLHQGSATGVQWNGLRIPELSPLPASEPVATRLTSDSLYVEYPRGDSYRVTLQGRSLVIDVNCRGRLATGLEALPISAPPDTLRPLTFPYLHEPDSAVPPVQIIQLPALTEPLFLHLMHDPYVSNASAIEGGRNGEWSWRAHYHPDTAGQRNHVHERIMLTVSSQLIDVLPRIPNPTDPQRRQWSSLRLLTVPAADVAEDRKWAQTAWLWQGGMSNVLYLTTDAVWRQNTDSRSFRLQANPHEGGNAALREFIDRQANAGWRTALYTNFREMSPLNVFWSSDALLRTPAGAWQPVNDQAFRVKPAYAVEWALRHVDTLQQTFAPGAYWLDQFTAQPPWTGTDYDRRSPGAATFSQALFADGDLLESLRQQSGQPLIGRTGATRFYAGLVDALVTEQPGNPADYRPFNPLYKLQHVQPLSIVYGPEWTHAATGQGIDDYLATQIAYGNAVQVIGNTERIDEVVRTYYGVGAWQHRYLLQRPLRILYSDGQQYVTPEKALSSEIASASRLYLAYPDDLEVWVNGNAGADWNIRADGRQWTLPPSGWLAKSPDLLAFSALHEEHRIDYLAASDYLYFDPRDSETVYGAFHASSPLVVRREADGGFLIWDVAQTGGYAIARSLPARPVARIDCYSLQREFIAAGEWIVDGDWLRISGPSDAAYYRLYLVAEQ
jgi:hypothetical protein